MDSRQEGFIHSVEELRWEDLLRLMPMIGEESLHQGFEIRQSNKRDTNLWQAHHALRSHPIGEKGKEWQPKSESHM